MDDAFAVPSFNYSSEITELQGGILRLALVLPLAMYITDA
jgi:hypothetical protein